MSIHIICARLQNEFGMTITQTKNPDFVVIENDDAVINLERKNGAFTFTVLLLKPNPDLEFKIKSILHGYEINLN